MAGRRREKTVIGADDVATMPPVIIEAAGTAASSLGKSGYARRIEEAMTDAVTECLANGVTDPEVILKRKLAARSRLLTK